MLARCSVIVIADMSFQSQIDFIRLILSHLFVVLRLSVPELGVSSIRRNELLVVAMLDDPAVLEH